MLKISFLLFLYLEAFIYTADTKFPYTIEGEDMLDEKGGKTQLWTAIYTNEIPGYSGEGFAYISQNSMYFEVSVSEGGMYQISVRAAQILDEGARHQTIAVNGIEYSKDIAHTDTWKDFDFGIVRFKAGKNKIEFLNKYGFMAIDTVTVDLPNYPNLQKADSTPCDPKAIKQVKTVMSYLHSVYGKHIISGQQEIYGGGHDGKYDYEMDYIKKLTGKLPALRAIDIANVNNLYGWDDGCFERTEEWWEKGGLISYSYHLTLPTDWSNYRVGDKIDWSPSAVTYQPVKAFKVANASVKGTKENDFLNENIALIAQKFLELQEKGIPIIFRPFHEAEGNAGIGNAWFWWGQEGSEPFKKLWIYLYKQLTQVHGVHNIIYELNLYAWNDASADWYPGDDYVDIVGFDKYNVQYNRHDGKTSGPNEDAESGIFYTLVNSTKNKKMVSMPENDTVPSLSNLVTEKAAWLYFCIWYDDESNSNFVSGKNFQDPDTLKELYQSDYCITLDELPDFSS